MSVRSGSWSTDSSCSPLFVNLPHIFEWVLFHNPLQGAVIPIACTLFSTTSFPSLRLSINVLGHRALWTASLFCNDLLCLALLVQGVNGRLLDNCQVSSLPHDCVAYRTRLRPFKGLCRCFEFISWLECGTRCLQNWTFSQYSNFLRFWIWGFHLVFTKSSKLKEINTWNISVCVKWMYTLYKFHFLNGITEINKLFDDILIIWPAPV